MEFYSRLYVGDTAKKSRRKIISKLKKRKPQLGIYVLCLPANEENTLDIYPAYVLLQPHFKERSLYVMGIACGREEALEVMTKMVMDSAEKTGSYKPSALVVRE